MSPGMKQVLLTASVIVIACVYTNCNAADCACVDWVNKGGYCVDYVKDKIPSFPIPLSTTEIVPLKNKDITEITKGDVAIFNYRKFWHVAYVEKVHRDQQGAASAIDVSEMNFGDQISFDEFKSIWKSKSESEWKRAVCCGVTDKYDQLGFRKNIALDTVKQIWSPAFVATDGISIGRYSAVVEKIRQVFNQLLDFKEREL
jgi:hypothetical protein